MSTQVAVPVAQPDAALARQAAPKTIKELLKSQQLKVAVAAALPRHLTPDRFIRIALNAVMRQPELLNCSQDSLFRCLLDLSSYGLEPDGRRAHLIPFKNKGKLECQLIIDYKGIAELVRRSGDVSYIHADIVYENDTFVFAYGSQAHLTHVPNMEDRGKKRKCAYSFVKLRDGSEDFVVMTLPEIDKIRSRSRAGQTGPWVSDYDEMAKKTVFRRHSKWLPLSPENRDVIEHDEPTVDSDAVLGAVSIPPAEGGFKDRLLAATGDGSDIDDAVEAPANAGDDGAAA